MHRYFGVVLALQNFRSGHARRRSFDFLHKHKMRLCTLCSTTKLRGALSAPPGPTGPTSRAHRVLRRTDPSSYPPHLTRRRKPRLRIVSPKPREASSRTLEVRSGRNCNHPRIWKRRPVGRTCHVASGAAAAVTELSAFFSLSLPMSNHSAPPRSEPRQAGSRGQQRLRNFLVYRSSHNFLHAVSVLFELARRFTRRQIAGVTTVHADCKQHGRQYPGNNRRDQISDRL